MARTVDLKKVRSSFLDNLANGVSAWEGAQDAPRRKTFAEDIFLRFAVGWENFISDWFIGGLISYGAPPDIPAKQHFLVALWAPNRGISPVSDDVPSHYPG